MLSHWKGKTADRLSFSIFLILTHKPHTKPHSLSPPSRHHHHQTHTYTLTQPRVMDAERRMRHIVTPQPSCGIVYRLSSHGLIKNKPDRSKSTAAHWRPCSQMTCIWHDILISMNITSHMGLTLWQVPVFIRKKAGSMQV